MSRVDYEKFIKLWVENPVKGYIVQNIDFENDFTANYTKIRKDKTTFLQPLEVGAIYTSISKPEYKDLYVSNYDELLDKVDSVYLITYPKNHYRDITRALNKGKHVLCEAPIALTEIETKELFELANSKDLVLMDAIKTAYSTAFNRMCLLIKSGEIGNIISVDASSTSLFEKDLNQKENLNGIWNSMCFWAPTALLPIFKILGSDYKKLSLISLKSKEDDDFDLFTKADFIYDNAVASFKIGRGVKTEGEVVITGTKCYVVVPAPWWKTDYFEIRYEDQTENKRYFYQLDGEGIRHQLLSFKNSISNGSVVGMIAVVFFFFPEKSNVVLSYIRFFWAIHLEHII